MSRIGKQPILAPGGVEIDIKDHVVAVKGPKGALSVPIAAGLKVAREGDAVIVGVESDDKADDKAVRSRWGLTRSLIANAVTGVSEGIAKTLEIRGVGYRAAVQGKTLECSLGYSKPIAFPFPEGVSIACPRPTEIVVSGIDKQRVGQVAADIRSLRPPEPYKGKGVRHQGEYVPIKEGKNK